MKDSVEVVASGVRRLAMADVQLLIINVVLST